jgi:hypothetical protein
MLCRRLTNNAAVLRRPEIKALPASEVFAIEKRFAFVSESGLERNQCDQREAALEK